MLLVTSHQESRFRANAVGDGGRSLGAFELQGVRPVDAFDVRTAARLAYSRLRESAKVCPAAPLAFYVSGDCHNRTGRRMSAYRMRMVRRVLEVARETAEVASEAIRP